MANFLKLPTRSQGLYRVVIETPRGSAAKLAYEPSSGSLSIHGRCPSVTPIPTIGVSFLRRSVTMATRWMGSSYIRRPLHRVLSSNATCWVPCGSSKRIRMGPRYETTGIFFARTRRTLRTSGSKPIMFRRICGVRSNSSSSRRCLEPARN